MAKDCVTGKKKCVLEVSYLRDYMLAWGRLHRSKERKSLDFSPFASYMMNKKWILEEEFNNHILRFQQVNIQYLQISNWILTVFYRRMCISVSVWYSRLDCWWLKWISPKNMKRNRRSRWEWNISFSPLFSCVQDYSCQLQRSWLRSSSSNLEETSNRQEQKRTSLYFMLILSVSSCWMS